MTVSLTLEYRFSKDFRLKEMRSSHNFERVFREAKERGIGAGIEQEEFLKKLEDRIRYYDGEKWTAEPAMRNEW